MKLSEPCFLREDWLAETHTHPYCVLRENRKKLSNSMLFKLMMFKLIFVILGFV